MSREYFLQPFRAPIHLRIDYANELNAQQHAAVTAPPGPALVIAGAGSGKTRTLVYRVAFLLEQGIPPQNILLLTFTNKAAGEMMRRASELIGAEPAALWGGTFHSIGNRILRRHAELIGFRPQFTILDREDSKDLLQTCIAEMGIDTKAGRFPKPDVIGDIFSLAVNKELPVLEIIRRQFDHFSEIAAKLAALKECYVARKKSANAMDFDDLLSLWLKLLEDHPQVREEQQRRFQFILVDEYQDTNQLQGRIIDLLAARHHNLMVVGDDSQSIYSWRGAHFLNILEFPKRYSEAKTYRIETNYRSTPQILELANAAIAANTQQYPKLLTAARPNGAKPVLVVCNDAAEQAAFIAQHVLELREGGADLKTMAVLYRAHFHALELQLELTRRNIPYAITSGVHFFEQAHVKDVAAYLKWITNPGDETAFKRIVRLLPGVGDKSADKYWAKFQSLLPANSLAARLQACASGVSKKSAAPWAQLMATIAQLEDEKIRRHPSRMIELVLEADYEDYLRQQYTNYESREEDIKQLAVFALQFETTEDFLAQLALLTSVDAETRDEERADEDQLRLTTIHQAKGLEFDIVFIIMLCDGLFPSNRSLDTTEGEEEERRLFYVAVTRARNELYLSYPLLRMAPGGGGDPIQQPSRFLNELPKNLLEEWILKPFDPYG